MHDFVIHGSAVQRVRMCDDGDPLGHRLRFAQNDFEFTRRAIDEKLLSNRRQVVDLNNAANR